MQEKDESQVTSDASNARSVSRRKVLQYGLAGGGLILGAGLLAACGANGSPSSANSTANGSSFGKAAKGKVVLRFPSWQWGQPGYDEFFSAALAAFTEQHPNVTFQKIPIESASYASEMVKMYVANDPPEINQFLSQLYYQAASAGWYETLDSPLKGTDIETSWSPFLDKAAVFDGNRYGIWISGSSQALMYNKKMFAEANLQPPTTSEELLTSAKTLTKDAAGGKQYGYSITTKMDVNGYIYGLSSFIAGFGGSWVKSGKLDVSHPANTAAIEFERDLVKAGATPLGLDRIAARQAFYEGKAAMMIEGPWVMTSAAKENPGIVAYLGVVKLPFKNQVAGTSNGFAMAKNQKYSYEAWQFIKMIMSKPWQEKYGEMTGVAPGRSNSLTPKALQSAPWLTTFAEAQDKGKSYITPGFETQENQIGTIIAQEVNDVFFGNDTAVQALARIADDFKKIKVS